MQALPPPSDSAGRAPGDTAEGRSRPLPMFPTRVIAEESATASRTLADPACMMPGDDDPNMATPIGAAADIGTCTARFEFKGLEFARPTRMVRMRPGALLTAAHKLPRPSLCAPSAVQRGTPELV